MAATHDGQTCHFVNTLNLNKEFLIKRTSITLADPIYENGLSIAATRGFGQSFSAYVAWLIQRDAEGGVTREEATSRASGSLAVATSSRRKPMSARPKQAAKTTTAKTPRAKAKAAAPATASATKTRATKATKAAKATPAAKPGRKPAAKPAAKAAQAAKAPTKRATATTAPRRTAAKAKKK